MAEGEPTKEPKDPHDVTEEFLSRPVSQFRDFFESLQSGTYFVKVPLSFLETHPEILTFVEALHARNALRLLVEATQNELDMLAKRLPELHKQLMNANKTEVVR
ncbi:MAG: hypothetical protein HYV13_02000 [Candidatus Doudnabacteria bacterium]|nr:hypothetical protein [Candidatus Doudnabacteria bacterium]